MKREPFQRLMDTIEQPLVLVTAAHRRASTACLVTFSSQCSLEPPRYCLYVPKHEAAYDVVRRAAHLLAHFLDRRQRDLAAMLAAGEDVFAAAEWRAGPDGRTPQLRGVDAWLFGRVTARHEVGDHGGFVLDPARIRVPRRLRLLARDDLRVSGPAQG
jgi:flavin reductase (DIM6/NTAB) family NADH-FMN oxidoreductase RutF